MDANTCYKDQQISLWPPPTTRRRRRRCRLRRYLPEPLRVPRYQDRDAVAALNHQPIDPNVRHKELPKLAERAKQKRVDHDSFLKQFELKLTEISDDLEIRVMHASRGVQKATASNDQRIGEIFGELNQDLLLVTKDHPYVLDSWDEIHAVCEKRFADIRGFAAELEGIERDR